MFELTFLKILLQFSISLLHSVPTYKPKVLNLGGVYMLHEFYGQQRKLMHYTVMVMLHENLQGTDKNDSFHTRTKNCMSFYRQQKIFTHHTVMVKLHESL